METDGSQKPASDLADLWATTKEATFAEALKKLVNFRGLFRQRRAILQHPDLDIPPNVIDRETWKPLFSFILQYSVLIVALMQAPQWIAGFIFRDPGGTYTVVVPSDCHNEDNVAVSIPKGSDPFEMDANIDKLFSHALTEHLQRIKYGTLPPIPPTGQILFSHPLDDSLSSFMTSFALTLYPPLVWTEIYGDKTHCFETDPGGAPADMATAVATFSYLISFVKWHRIYQEYLSARHTLQADGGALPQFLFIVLSAFCFSLVYRFSARADDRMKTAMRVMMYLLIAREFYWAMMYAVVAGFEIAYFRYSGIMYGAFHPDMVPAVMEYPASGSWMGFWLRQPVFYFDVLRALSSAILTIVAIRAAIQAAALMYPKLRSAAAVTRSLVVLLVSGLLSYALTEAGVVATALGYALASDLGDDHKPCLTKYGCVLADLRLPPSPRLDERFWDSIRASADPADFQRYLKRYPHGLFADLARQRLRRGDLKSARAQAPGDLAAAPDPQTQQSQAATPSASVESFLDCEDCPEMVYVPAGQFLMGGDAIEEQPRRTVSVRKEFAIGKYLVKRGEFSRFVEEERYVATGCDIFVDGLGWTYDSRRSWRDPGFEQTDDDPVVCVSWHDAKAYAFWLAKSAGKSYRLATEAEWEYAARARTMTARWWGADIGTNHANCRGCGSLWGGKGTSPTWSFAANPFDLYDMLGNAEEWVEDCWNDTYEDAPSDASVSRQSGACFLRVVRGGSWFDAADGVTASQRKGFDSFVRSSMAGFRVVRSE
jgi:formylglycine-generating enzyme required for sulfatase activity